jgi:hypothetical protein
VHGLIALYLEVIALAIILLCVELAVLRVLIFATRKIVALIVLMTIVGSFVVVITLVALMLATIVVATMLLVAGFMAMHGGCMVQANVGQKLLKCHILRVFSGDL